MGEHDEQNFLIQSLHEIERLFFNEKIKIKKKLNLNEYFEKN